MSLNLWESVSNSPDKQRLIKFYSFGSSRILSNAIQGHSKLLISTLDVFIRECISMCSIFYCGCCEAGWRVSIRLGRFFEIIDILVGVC